MSVLGLAACTAKPKKADAGAMFSSDSAYAYIAHQMSFGARVPGSEAHGQCREWLVSQFEDMGVSVEEQQGVMEDYAGQEQVVRNIVAHIEGSNVTMPSVLLCAHWDCRPWCDEESDYSNRFEPVPGANDGASGVGVLLEVARQLQALRGTDKQFPSVDIVLFDCEDMGTPSHYTGKERENTWCLGSQLWAKRYVQERSSGRGVQYQYGILLDMVGDPSATFPKEHVSMAYASGYVERIWRVAESLGYGRYFVLQRSYSIVDDHYYVNTIAGIPCVDIIDYKMGTETGFAEWWHTRADDMSNINKQTLQAVGETVLSVLCSR